MRGRSVLEWTRFGSLVVAGCLATMPVSAQNIDVTGVRAERTRAAREELRRSGEDGFEGQLVERVRGSYVFVPSRIGLPPAPVSNPEKDGALAVGLPLQIQGRIDSSGRIEIQEYELLGPPRDRGASAELAAVIRAADEIVSAVDHASKPGKSRGGDGVRASEAEKTRRSIASIVAEYRKALTRGVPKRAASIANEWAEVRPYVATLLTDEPQYKAIYGPSDNYPPWRYGVIQQQSRAVVAIGESGQNTARCSGVLIAPDLVLTAAHCFSEPDPRPPTQLEVWFDYAEKADGAILPIQRRPIAAAVAPAPARWAELMDRKFSTSLLDFAIVRFKSPGAEPAVPVGVAPQCLRATPLGRGDPIYVVGYPRGGRVTVHDNARVYLPYRELDGDRFYQLRLDVEADFIGTPSRDQVMEEFDKSYELETDANGIAWRYLRSVNDAFQPRMGIVADTFRGNSGGPVFDHERDQCVAGILIAGAPDTGVRRTPTWREHERVLPASAVIDALRGDLAMEPIVHAATLKD